MCGERDLRVLIDFCVFSRVSIDEVDTYGVCELLVVLRTSLPGLALCIIRVIMSNECKSHVSRPVLANPHLSLPCGSESESG